MKIGIEAQRILRPNRHGMDVVALELVRNLLAMDRENHYTVYLDRPDRRNELGTWPNLVKRVLRTPSYPLWEQVAVPLELCVHPVDLVHFTSNTAPILCPVPTVITVHDVIYLTHQASLQKGRSLYHRLGWWYRRWNVPRTAPAAASLVTVSSYEKGRLVEALRVDPDRVKVIYNGVGEQFFQRATRGELDATLLALEIQRPFILFLGNRDPKKNTDRALHAWALWRREHPDGPDLVVAELGRDEVEQRLASAGLGDMAGGLVCPGYIPHQRLVHLYQAARLFLYPSLAESFGLPLLEAMASGTPVLSSNTTAIPEIAGDAALLVDPSHTHDIVAGLEQILGSDSLRKDLVSRGLERARGFSWSQNARATLGLYRDLLGSTSH